MGKRRPNDAGLEDQDPYAARMNAGAVAKPSAFGTSSFGTSSFGTAPPPTFGFGDTGGPSRPALFLHHLRALNDQFAGWVKQRVAENPLEPMTSGVIDYLAHVKQVRRSIPAKGVVTVHLILLDTSSAASLLWPVHGVGSRPNPGCRSLRCGRMLPCLHGSTPDQLGTRISNTTHTPQPNCWVSATPTTPPSRRTISADEGAFPVGHRWRRRSRTP